MKAVQMPTSPAFVIGFCSSFQPLNSPITWICPAFGAQTPKKYPSCPFSTDGWAPSFL